MIDATFIQAGKAIFTVEVPEAHRPQGAKPHYTFKVTSKDDRILADEKIRFLSLLTGPDNTSDYAYIGILKSDGNVKLTGASRMTAESYPVKLASRVISRIISGDVGPILDAGFDVHHEGRCCRCGRKLTTPESIKAGIGPECAGKI